MVGQRGMVVGGIVIVVFSLAADKPPAKPPAMKPAPEMVRDREWMPVPGIPGEIVHDNVPATPTLEAYQQYAIAHKAGDAAGLNEFFARNPGVRIPRGTQVLILRNLRPDGPAYSITAADAIDIALNPPAQAGMSALEVRILDGELKDQKRFVPEDAVAHMIPAPVVPGRKKIQRSVPAAKPTDPALRAATLLRSARNLEAAGKSAGALTIYQQVVKEYPGTPQATMAAKQIQAIKAP
jgi:hypothetical protein